MGRIIKFGVTLSLLVLGTKFLFATEKQTHPSTTVDHLRSALQSTCESEKRGDETLIELQRQREQLINAQHKLEEVEAHVARGNWILNGMKSWFGIRGWEPKKGRPDARAKYEAEGMGHDKKIDHDVKKNSGNKIKANPVEKSKTTKNSEENALLEQISCSLVRLKARAQAMGSEISEQDGIIDALTESVGKVDKKIKDVTWEAKKLTN